MYPGPLGITGDVTDDEILEEQEGKGYGEDEGEREGLLDAESDPDEESADE